MWDPSQGRLMGFKGGTLWTVACDPSTDAPRRLIRFYNACLAKSLAKKGGVDSSLSLLCLGLFSVASFAFTGTPPQSPLFLCANVPYCSNDIFLRASAAFVENLV